MGQRASWIIDLVLPVAWDVTDVLSSPVDDNPVTGVAAGPSWELNGGAGDWELNGGGGSWELNT